VDKQVVGSEPDELIVEIPDDTPEADVEHRLDEEVQVLIQNAIDAGWRELEPDE
jgi:hypothetical protein